MKTNPILLAITTISLATPAMIQNARSGHNGEELAPPPDRAPRAGLVTVIENRPDADRPRWRVAWKSLSALPLAERERLRALVREFDRANRARAPLAVPRTLHPMLLAPACMADAI